MFAGGNNLISAVKGLACVQDITLGARGFSCAVSGIGQVLKGDPREKPLDKSAIPLIAPSQLQPRRLANRFGISETALNWFGSNLQLRKQFVTVNGIDSSLKDLQYGVLQGSCVSSFTVFTLH